MPLLNPELQQLHQRGSGFGRSGILMYGPPGMYGNGHALGHNWDFCGHEHMGICTSDYFLQVVEKHSWQKQWPQNAK